MDNEFKKQETITDKKIEQAELSVLEKNRLRDEIIRIESLFAPPLEDVTEKDILEEGDRAIKEIIANSDILEKALHIGKEFYGSIEALNKLMKFELPEMHNLALSIFERNLPVIESYIKNDEDLFNYQCLFAINNLAAFGNDEQQKIGIEALSRHADALAFSMNYSVPHLYFPFIETLVKKGDIETAQEALSTLEGNLYSGKWGISNFELLSQSFTSGQENIKKIADDIIKRELALYKLDNIQQLLDAWRVSMPPASDPISSFEVGTLLERNIHTIRQIEANRPGAISLLSKEFGIFDFGRYPIDMLISQYDNYDDDKKPYGVIFYPMNDHNGAFYYNLRAFRQLFEQLKGNYAIRIAEGESKVDIVKFLHRFDKKYGKKHKISFAIIGGHGTWMSIKFGGNDKKHTLDTTDLWDKKHPASKRKKFFEHAPTFILNSCSTGVGYGIAEQLSGEMDATVIAPSEPTNLRSISVKIKEDKLNFSVEYGKKGISTVYATGKNHENTGN